VKALLRGGRGIRGVMLMIEQQNRYLNCLDLYLGDLFNTFAYLSITFRFHQLCCE